MKQILKRGILLSLGIFLAISGVGLSKSVYRSKGTLTMDGVLSDWEEVVPTVFGTDSIAVYLAYGSDRLYMAVYVPDTNVIVDKLSSDFSQGDFVRIGIASGLESTKPGGEVTGPYIFTFSPPTEFGQPLVALDTGSKSELVFDLRDVRVAGTTTTNAYVIETSFPAQAFGLARFRRGQKLSVNVMVHNTDGRKARVICWSGSAAWTEPSTWPILELSR